MNDLSASVSAHNLLEHESFVRTVARGLLRDEHAADDVTQDFLLRSLEGGAASAPRADGGVRSWIAAVTRNAARDARRQDVRRAAREQRAARSEAQESVAVAFERLSLQREVVGAILALAEPYRTVVLLRYYHDLGPAEIAERLGAKPATVRTQLARAHELLRARLDAQRDRRAWAALLLADAPFATARSFPWTGVAATAAAGILATSAWLALRDGAAAAPAVARAAPEPAIASAPAPELLAPAVENSVRSARAVASAPAREPEPVAAAPLDAELLARAELFDRDAYRDRPDAYERATFSFEHGLRDDPGSAITRNDWDVLFTQGIFDAHMVVDDTGIIADLGALRLADLAAADPATLRAAVAGAAALRFRPANHGVRGTGEIALVALGHTYFVWTRDSDTDALAAFEVLELVPGDRCLLEWYGSKDGVTGRGSLAAPTRTAAVLRALRDEARAQAPLRRPRVRLQVRAGSNGGNPNAIDMAGCASAYVDRVETGPLDVFTPVDGNEDVLAFADGGFLPPGRTFVVTRVTWSGSARGDSNGHGGFELVVGGAKLADHDTTVDAIQGAWTGSVEIAPGDERATYLVVRNSSAGEALLEGHWKP